MSRPATFLCRFAASPLAGPSRFPQLSLNGALRAASTTSEVSPSNYPFSRTAHIPPVPRTPAPPSALAPRAGASLVSHVNDTLLETYDPKRLLKTLFSRRHPIRAMPGSVITVISYTSPAKTTTSTFSGVLLSISRRGVDTSFKLRNMVGKTGVETSFKVCSPMIKDIIMVKRADGKSGLRYLGRAKVNYLRERPQLMAQIASALKMKSK